MRLAKLLALTLIVTVLAGAVLAVVILDGGAGSEETPGGTAAAVPAAPTATAAASGEPQDAAELPDAVILQWIEWSQDAGAWNADVLRGGVSSTEPLHLGYGIAPIVSPDGRFIASADRQSGEVTVIDLAAWEPALTAQTAPDVFLHAWSEDGSQVYGWREYCPQPAQEGVCLGDWQRDLWRVDLDRHGAKRLAVFDFSIMELQIDPHRDATRAYALGIVTDICCAIDPVGDPFIAVLDLARGEVTRKIPLPGFLAGQLDHGLEDGKGASFFPATVLAPDGSRLYVVDAAEDAVLVVDLDTFAVERVELREQRSALSRFGSWLRSQLVSTAEAKGGPSFHRLAGITPDGRYLIVGGTSAQEVALKDGSTSLEDRPSGLMIVDTQSMTIVRREKEAAWFNLSPDGRWLLAYGSYFDEDLGEDGHGDIVAYGLKVIDLDSLDLVSRLWPGEDVRPGVFSADSRYVYVTMDGPGMAAARRAGFGCNHDCSRLNLLDLAASEIVWQGKLDEQQSILAFPPAR